MLLLPGGGQLFGSVDDVGSGGREEGTDGEPEGAERQRAGVILKVGTEKKILLNSSYMDLLHLKTSSSVAIPVRCP